MPTSVAPECLAEVKLRAGTKVVFAECLDHLLNLVLDVESKLFFIGCANSAPDGSSPRVYGRVLATVRRLKLYYSKILMLMSTSSNYSIIRYF